jgi:hypothetical protein
MPVFKYASIGSISRATLRTDDLIDAFADALLNLIEENRDYYSSPERDMNELNDVTDMRARVREARDWLDYHGNGNVDPEEWDQHMEDGMQMQLQLIDDLNCFAPPYVYFGPCQGDSADFGFWPDDGEIEEGVRDGFLLKVNDLSAIPPTYEGDVILVNDHGNITIGHQRMVPQFESIWDCV